MTAPGALQYLWPLLVALMAMAAFWRRRRSLLAARRVAHREAGLDFTIDLMTVVLGSGGTVRRGVEIVAKSGPIAVRGAFESILDRSAAGLLLADALAPASHELGPAFHPLVGALIAAERDGAPVAMILQHLADEAEQARRWRAEALAKRMPVAMLLPLVTCLLPAVVIGAVLPLAIVSIRQLRG